MKKTVFISSTFQDLADHRRAIWQVLERFDVAIRGMEQFGARTEAPLETCLAEVEQSDVYVGVVAFRLGSIEQSSGKSFTQLEYERAAALGRSILIYLADEGAARVRYADIEVDSQPRERLAAFKATVRERHTVAVFTTPEDLAEKIARDFSRDLQPKELTPVADEFNNSAAMISRFLLLPNSVVGREVRLRLRFVGKPFPASRVLCKAFNLLYGSTVGADVRVDAPAGDAKSFKEIFATGTTAGRLVELAESRDPVELYARLQFCEQDVRRVKAEFFGYSYWDDPDPGDPNERYVAPEGKAILLFSKAPPAA